MLERSGPSRPSAAVRPVARRDAVRQAGCGRRCAIRCCSGRSRRRDCRGAAAAGRSGPPARLSSGRTAAAVRVRARRRSPCRGSRARCAVSEIAWVRPSSGAVRIATRPRFCSTDSLRLTGPLSKPITWQMREAGMPGSIASSDMIRHSVTLTPKLRLIEHGRAVRQLVGDEGDERRNVAVEIERRAVIGCLRISAGAAGAVFGEGELGSCLDHRCETAIEQ